MKTPRGNRMKISFTVAVLGLLFAAFGAGRFYETHYAPNTLNQNQKNYIVMQKKLCEEILTFGNKVVVIEAKIIHDKLLFQFYRTIPKNKHYGYLGSRGVVVATIPIDLMDE